ncbi:MAG: glycosyltransferase, partial [Microbacteriaceae bacterium]|nr:glycosyltransferase [Microbacteriaceae bacterium]
VLAVGGLDGVSGLPALVRAALGPHAPEVPLLLVGVTDDELEALLRTMPDLDGEPEPGRVRALGVLDETDLAVAYARAAVVAVPALSAGSGLVALEAMSLGAPVVHSDAPALLEVCSDAGVVVARDDAEGYPARLAEAVRSVLDDSALAAELAVRGRDRARAFSWRDSAEKTWQLHADL